jgi:aminoglycoside phosphotransferase (APT) family kinase protein
MTSDGAIPEAVLAAYGPPYCDVHWRRVDSGFSGACVFAGTESARPVFALKAWPPGADSKRVHLARLYQHLAAKALDCIPRFILSKCGDSFYFTGQQHWELSDWRPGEIADEPVPAKVGNACVAIARLHRALAAASPSTRDSDPIRRRVEAVNELAVQCHSLNFGGHRNELTRETQKHLARIEALPFLSRHESQIVHGDLHREHVLFTGDAVTGIIDFASSKRDHPALDLARYLGDLAGDDDSWLNIGVEAYREAGGSEAVTPEIVRYLDRVITLGAAANWLLRFSRGEVPAAKYAAAAARLARTVSRLRTWDANAVSPGVSFS